MRVVSMTVALTNIASLHRGTRSLRSAGRTSLLWLLVCISVSSDVGERNLTLGQAGTSLIFRVRTPLTGDNADYIQATVPDVFTDNNPHKIIITYTNSVLQVYVDNLENLHSFYLLELLKKADKLLYYGLMFIPLGYLLSLIVILAQRRFILNLLLYSGILLPPLLLELILATSSGRSINPENLLLSVLITAIALLVFELQLPARLKNERV